MMKFFTILKQDFMSSTLIFPTNETESDILLNLTQIIPIHSSVLSL